MATSRIQVTEGVGKSAATHSITEDAVTKEIQRVVVNTPAGVDQAFGSGAIDTGTVRTVSAVDDPMVAAQGGLTETAPATDIASSGLNGRLQRIAQRLTSLIALTPASLGAKAAAASLAVTQSTEDIALTGALAEAAPTTDTASSGLNGRLQRVAQRLTTFIALFPASLGSKAAAASLAVTDSTEDIARVGIITETAPATDTASSGLNGRLQRVAQRLTSLIALLPASIGTKTAAASLSVTMSSDGPFVAQTGSLTETAPASDTASSGLNGRLQRIAQRITSFIALLPADLSTGGAFKVTATDFTTGAEVALATQTTAVEQLGRTPNLLPSGAAPAGIVDSNGVELDYAVDSFTSRIVASGTTTMATVAKAGAGTLFNIHGFNDNDEILWIKFYNKATSPVVGTDPVVLGPLYCAPNLPFEFHWPTGRAFSTGIAYGICKGITGVNDNDTTVLDNGDLRGLSVGYA